MKMIFQRYPQLKLNLGKFVLIIINEKTYPISSYRLKTTKIY